MNTAPTLIRYMLYLAQTCRMMTEDGYFKDNIKGSGQIADGDPASMWRAAGCFDIYPGYDVDKATFVDPVEYCEEKDGRTMGVGARAQKRTESLRDCIDWCKQTQWCVAYSWAKVNAVLGDSLQCYIRDNDTGEKDQPGRISGRWVASPCSTPTPVTFQRSCRCCCRLRMSARCSRSGSLICFRGTIDRRRCVRDQTATGGSLDNYKIQRKSACNAG